MPDRRPIFITRWLNWFFGGTADGYTYAAIFVSVTEFYGVLVYSMTRPTPLTAGDAILMLFVALGLPFASCCFIAQLQARAHEDRT